MNLGQTVFSQLLQHLPHKQFQKCVARYGGDSYVKSLSCWDQFLAMVFAQLTYRESLRDIEACLRSIGGKRYHMGFRSTIARSTLADANESRDWRIYADFAQVLIGIPRAVSASNFSATTVSRGYASRTGAGKSSIVGYSNREGFGTI